MQLQCDMCNKWSHLECVGMTTEEANTIDCWFCETCEKQNDYFFDNKNISVKDTLNLSQCSSMLEKKTSGLTLFSGNMSQNSINNP